jgi:hypothetical protein
MDQIVGKSNSCPTNGALKREYKGKTAKKREKRGESALPQSLPKT